MMGMEEKPRNTKTNAKTKEKIPRLVALPALSTKWRPTVFRFPKTPKTSQTCPRWERDPSFMGQKAWVRYGVGS